MTEANKAKEARERIESAWAAEKALAQEALKKPAHARGGERVSDEELDALEEMSSTVGVKGKLLLMLINEIRASRELLTLRTKASTTEVPANSGEVNLPDYIRRYNIGRDAEGFSTGSLVPSDFGPWASMIGVFRMAKELQALRAEVGKGEHTAADLEAALWYACEGEEHPATSFDNCIEGGRQRTREALEIDERIRQERASATPAEGGEG